MDCNATEISLVFLYIQYTHFSFKSLCYQLSYFFYFRKTAKNYQTLPSVATIVNFKSCAFNIDNHINIGGIITLKIFFESRNIAEEYPKNTFYVNFYIYILKNLNLSIQK